MSTYYKITPEIAEKLIAIVGEKNVIFNDDEKIEAYSHDEVSDMEKIYLAEIVVKPKTAEEISEIMKLASQYVIPVTPRGAGSGLSAGAVPVFGGIVLSVERMNQILEIDKENMVAVVEPGVVTNEINETIKDDGLFFAGYPMSLLTCFISGNVAENAGGGKAIKYGVTGQYVLGLEVVLPTGEIVSFGGKRVKDVVGYDLVHLMVGSEGTLGIFTKIILKLIPLPTKSADLLVLFKDVESAIRIVPKIMTQSRIIPTAIEFMDKASIVASCKYLNEDLDYAQAGAMLLIEVDGVDEERVEQDMEVIGELCLEQGAIEVYVAANHTTQERVWSVRRNIAEAFMIYSPEQSLEDVVVPFSRIPELMPLLDQLSEEFDVLIPCYGHAGDGNLHATVVKKPDMDMESWHIVKDQVLAKLYEGVVALGGTISGEHGIGAKRKAYLPQVLDQKVIDLQKAIKKVFDPQNIMNPGKIFPD